MNHGYFYWITDQQDMYEQLPSYNKIIKERFKEAIAIGIDIETTGIDLYIDRILTVQIAIYTIAMETSTAKPIICVFDWTSINMETKLLIKEILESNTVKIGHNLKFDYKFLKHHTGIQINTIWDTFIVEKVLTSGSNQELNLKHVTYKYTNEHLVKSIRDEFFEKEEKLSLRQIEKNYTNKELKESIQSIHREAAKKKKAKHVEITEPMKKYAADDVKYLYHIYKSQKSTITKLKDTLNVNLERVINMENALVSIYAEIELKGIKLDKDKWNNNIDILNNEVKKYEAILIKTIKTIEESKKKEFIEDQIHEYMSEVPVHPEDYDTEMKYAKDRAERKYKELKKKHKKALSSNIQQNLFEDEPDIIAVIKLNSNKDILELLHSLDLNPQLRDKHSGQLKDSSSHVALEQYVHPNSEGIFESNYTDDPDFEIYPAILNYRNALKAQSTYGKSFLHKYINPDTQRIHPNYKQLGADTGRVACTNPNMQNIPSDKAFRECFVAEPGYKIITADYSQAEIRIVAELTNEPNLIKAFNKNEDPYGMIGTKMFKVTVSKKENKHLRDISKIILLGLNYGMEAKQLSTKINTDVVTAQDYIDIFQKEFKNLHWGLYNLGKAATQCGYSLSMIPFQRIRWYPQMLDILRIEEEEKEIEQQNLNHSEHPTSNQAIGKSYKQNTNDLYKDTETNSIKAIKASTSRAGKNMPIQGTNADLTKLATYFIHKHIVNNNLDAAIINQVHDEIVIEAKEEIAESLAKVIEQLMLKAGTYILKKLKTPIEYHIDNCWSK